MIGNPERTRHVGELALRVVQVEGEPVANTMLRILTTAE
jgi:hypothetical protein